MSRHLVLSFRFLSPWFHGRGDEGEPEWPPSPLRAFQALVTTNRRQRNANQARLRTLVRDHPEVAVLNAHAPLGVSGGGTQPRRSGTGWQRPGS